MPRYVLSLEAFVTAPSPEEAENRWHTGEYKAYVVQVDEANPAFADVAERLFG